MAAGGVGRRRERRRRRARRSSGGGGQERRADPAKSAGAADSCGDGALHCFVIQARQPSKSSDAQAAAAFLMATPALELFLPLRAPAGSPLLQMVEGQAAVSVVGRHVGEVHVESLFVPQAEADEFTGVHSAALWYATRLSVYTSLQAWR